MVSYRTRVAIVDVPLDGVEACIEVGLDPSIGGVEEHDDGNAGLRFTIG